MDAPGRPFSDMRESGVLWAINRVLFHPRGYALALHFDDDENVTGWEIQGDGTEVWSFTSADEDTLFDAFTLTLENARG